MSTLDLHTQIADSYLNLLRNLSVEAQLDFISKLSLSIKAVKKSPRTADYYCGIWQSDESAVEIIEDIRASRTFTRQIEAL